ncbi:hypothetical protein C8Q79DRAFT_997408 [Trametes meyenii]|nr:hypothetical protein C8Q79DRAFT_997408 [Trametes meyenii]
METPKRDPDVEERDRLRKKVVEDTGGILSYFWPLHPIRLFIDLSLAALRLVQPLAPQLIPLLVFSVSLPVIFFLSGSSGYWVWKSVAVGWETEIFLQYGDGPIPYAVVALPQVIPQQAYDISLHLVVPANEANFELGNFMAYLTLQTPKNGTIAMARKPAIVLPTHTTPWSLLYNRPGTVDLNIPMFDGLTIGTSRALARVELGRKDQWKSIRDGQGRELAVLSGYIRGVVLHRGVRGIISRFPIASAVVASMVFFLIMFVGMIACLMPAVEWHFGADIHEPTPGDDRPHRPRRYRRKPEGEGDDYKPSAKVTKRTRSLGSGSRSRARLSSQVTELDVKLEPEVSDDPETSQIMAPPSPTASSQSLRRRRTQTPQDDFIED